MTDLLDFVDDAPVRRLLLILALLLIAIPFLQAGAQIWPFQPNNIRWRYDAATVLSGNLMLPFLGLSLLAILARLLESRGLGLFLGGVGLLLTVGLIASVVVFVLDALQLNTIVSSQMAQAFRNTSARVLVTSGLFAIGSLFVALAGLGAGAGQTRVAPAQEPRRASSRKSGRDDRLIVGYD